VLNLEYNGLTKIGPDDFKGMPKLKVLNLAGGLDVPKPGPISPEYMAQYLEETEEHRYLEQYKNAITEVDAAAFAGNPQLTMLSLEHNRLSSLPDGVFTTPALRVLKLHNNSAALHSLTKGQGPLAGLDDLKQLDLIEDTGDRLETWMRQSKQYLADDNGDEEKWWTKNYTETDPSEEQQKGKYTPDDLIKLAHAKRAEAQAQARAAAKADAEKGGGNAEDITDEIIRHNRAQQDAEEKARQAKADAEKKARQAKADAEKKARQAKQDAEDKARQAKADSPQERKNKPKLTPEEEEKLRNVNFGSADAADGVDETQGEMFQTETKEMDVADAHKWMAEDDDFSDLMNAPPEILDAAQEAQADKREAAEAAAKPAEATPEAAEPAARQPEPARRAGAPEGEGDHIEL